MPTNKTSQLDSIKLSFLACLLGLAIGYLAVLVNKSIGYIQNLILQNQFSSELIGYDNHILGYWFFLLIPISFIFIAAITKALAPEARGASITMLTDSSASIRLRLLFVKGIASVFTIAVGGSAGREGPLALMGASLGLSLQKLFRIAKPHKEVLIACALSGAVSAILNTPIAAVILAAEIILLNKNIKNYLPLMITSLFAALVMRSTYGGDSLQFILPNFQIGSATELLFYILLPLVVVVFALIFYKVFYYFEAKRLSLNVHYLWQALIAGFIISIPAWFYPQALGLSMDTFIQLLQGHGELKLVAIILLLKPIFTIATLVFAGAGGLLAPLLFMGATLGSLYGIVLQKAFPLFVSGFSSYAIIAAATLFAASSRAVLGSVLIVFELTSDYKVVLPCLLSCIIAEQISQAIKLPSIFDPPQKTVNKKKGKLL